MDNHSHLRKTALVLLMVMMSVSVSKLSAAIRVGDICRVKGQEENHLYGIGLVVGLKGTGDGDAVASTQMLSNVMKRMGQGILTAEQLKNAKNIATVFVTAVVPGTGEHEGGLLDCIVTAPFAKSLDGGNLLMAPLLGPNPKDSRIYAIAQGQIHIEDVNRPNFAKIHHGCRLETDIINQFSKDGKITLVLDEHHASFQTALQVTDAINNVSSNSSGLSENAADYSGDLAKPLNSKSIEITIPSEYKDYTVDFLAQILDQEIINPHVPALVVINQRTGTVVMGGDVEISAFSVTRPGFTIRGGGADTSTGSPFLAVDPAEQVAESTKVKVLVASLSAIKASPKEIIEILQMLEIGGELHGKIIVK